MSLRAYQNNRESEILGASPLELVEILYNAALQSIRDARRHLRDGEIKERSNAISKASAILSELTQSLDHEKGGSISKNLSALYDYMQGQLLKANVEQAEPPLAETATLLETLLEGWKTCIPAAPPSAYQNRFDEGHVPIACNF
jgi:flagellar secretion chaperone FliS